MPEGYELHEGRRVQELSNGSAANDLVIYLPAAVPAGKVWTVIALTYYPSVAETKYIVPTVRSLTTTEHAVRAVANTYASPTIRMGLINEGMELKLWPGDNIYVRRDSATAGSAMTIICRYIENDLPFYAYEEPLKKVVKKGLSHGIPFYRRGIISQAAGSSGGGGSESNGGGGGGGGEPVL